MLFILKHSDHSVQDQRELRRWYLDNGVRYSALADPALLDSVAQTVTVNTKVPIAGQEDSDCPKFISDANNEPVTVEQVIHLTAMPLRWMLTMTGAWKPGQGQPSHLRHA